MGRVTHLNQGWSSLAEICGWNLGEQMRETSLPNAEHLSWTACENLGV